MAKNDGIMRLLITIQGTTPLLMNKFTDAAAASATEGTRAMRSAPETPQEDAESRLHTNEDGKVIMPQPNLLNAFIYGGKFFKVGKSKITTMRNSLVPAAIGMDEIYYELIHKQPWKVDTRPIRIPATGGRINRHRPMFDDWEVSFDVTLDQTVIPVKMFREIVDKSGRVSGLGDFRPSCRGPFGKFVVTSWKEDKSK